MNWLLTGCLWLHVVAASWWVLACVTMALAGAVVSGESGEGGEFVLRVVPTFNRANAVAAVALLVTGLFNLVGAAQRRHFVLAPAFKNVLAAKLGLYILMLAALLASFGVERKLRGANAAVPAATRRLVALCALVALAGASAMMLGVWLAGV